MHGETAQGAVSQSKAPRDRIRRRETAQGAKRLQELFSSVIDLQLKSLNIKQAERAGRAKRGFHELKKKN